MLQHILLFVGIGFTNPFVPDFGTQFITATIIGTVVPKVIVSPLHCFLLKVPLLGAGICKFEQKLEDTGLWDKNISFRD
ncbi:hypothetical protein AKJ40_00950 [candidate division MSBL1 archaeon SCGC-AAA259M10]|uniref:Uncharacterized protein n=1 Tax=candidate division MSBL1 archaeon SCGC-AAA259M10 TaxID=1698270 RepID=A0A133V2M1_9EURY|nr:hypothetical protein AKJ40_00950 [candidate division MSBL1 archaeon SCGC-AAA259M10]